MTQVRPATADWEDVPTWAALAFGFGALALIVSVALTLLGIDAAHIGVVIGLLLMAAGQRGGEDALNRQRGQAQDL